MSFDEDSGVCSSASSTPNNHSPRIDVLSSLTAVAPPSTSADETNAPPTSHSAVEASAFNFPTVTEVDLAAQFQMFHMMCNLHNNPLNAQLMSQLNHAMFPSVPFLSAQQSPIERFFADNQVNLLPSLLNPSGMMFPLPTLPMPSHTNLTLMQPPTSRSGRSKNRRQKAPLNEESPLDLSLPSSTKTPPTDHSESPIVVVEDFPSPKLEDAKTPPLMLDDVPKLAANSKRNYSQLDLNAAVNDIRCGKLGTRRASVVYGIPRSTLRNKIYKLEAAEELSGQSTPSKRRRPGGQSTTERKHFDLSKLDVNVSDQRSSVSPASESQRSCTTSNDSIGTLKEANSLTSTCSELDSGIVFSSSKIDGVSPMKNPDWLNIFQTLFTPDQQPKTPSRSSKKHPTEVPSDWKKSRPKRGQYRRYDKNALDEAVQSVKRGEMSVHRAGSFYGVPHSTLEYKVKERHLQKNRKKEDSPAATLSGGSESSTPTENKTISDAVLDMVLPPNLLSNLSED